MFSFNSKKLQHFEEFVDSWDTVEHAVISEQGDKNIEHYLHIYMDKGFYNFLTEYDSLREQIDDGILSIEAALAELKKKFDSKPDIKEYVLIPRNVMWDIISEETNRRKKLSEIIDFINYTSEDDSSEENHSNHQ